MNTTTGICSQLSVLKRYERIYLLMVESMIKECCLQKVELCYKKWCATLLVAQVHFLFWRVPTSICYVNKLQKLTKLERNLDYVQVNFALAGTWLKGNYQFGEYLSPICHNKNRRGSRRYSLCAELWILVKTNDETSEKPLNMQRRNYVA